MIAKYHDELKKYIIEHNGVGVLDFFENIYINNENPDYRYIRSYSCDASCQPWMNLYYDVVNKYMHYNRKINLTRKEIYEVIDKLCSDQETNKEIKDIIDKKTDYEIKTEFYTIEDYIKMLITMLKVRKTFK